MTEQEFNYILQKKVFIKKNITDKRANQIYLMRKKLFSGKDFTRNLEETTHSISDIVEVRQKQIKADSVILDARNRIQTKQRENSSPSRKLCKEKENTILLKLPKMYS